ncbi:MAG: phospholipase D-like domain-containing protein [Candidatus Kariarchaeaceae archaeon]
MKVRHSILVSFFILFILTSNCHPITGHVNDDETELTLYTPTFDSIKISDYMTITPIITPDNALDNNADLLASATTSIDIQNQYITQFDNVGWPTDSSPIVQEIVAAHDRGVDIRIIVNEDSDSDDITSYFTGLGIDIRWMGESGGASYLSSTHNKYTCIDGETVIVSSINWGENAFLNNREAGLVIENTQVADYFTSIFDADWAAAEIPSSQPVRTYSEPISTDQEVVPISKYESHTDYNTQEFTGTYDVTLFANPDNANDVIFEYLNAATESVYVSMYTISRPELTNALIALKQANPSIDIKVLISKRRVGAYENIDTKEAAENLVDALIPVWNSSTGLNFYHNKYWIIDGKHTFVYSGNWSPRSITPLEATFSSSETNRDFGIAVTDAPDIASWFTTLFEADIAVGSPWELPVAVKVAQIQDGLILDGTTTIGAQVEGELTDIEYRWDSGSWSTFDSVSGGVYTSSIDTTDFSNGVHDYEVRGYLGTIEFLDQATVTIVNEGTWKVLITEVLYDPDGLDTEGEYIELTNSFSYDVYLGGWKIGDDNDLLTFPAVNIDAGESFLIVRSLDGVNDMFGVLGDYELGMSLSNGGDYAQFLDVEDVIIDAIAWGDETAPDGSETFTDIASSGEALLRIDVDVDTDSASDFELGTPTPASSGLGNGTVGEEVGFNLWISLTSGVALLIILKKKPKK